MLHYTHYTTTNTTATILIALHRNYNSCTLQLELQLGYTSERQQLRVQQLQPLQEDNSNHLLVHQWIRFAIRDAQQPNSPRGSYAETSAIALCDTTGIMFSSCITSHASTSTWPEIIPFLGAAPSRSSRIKRQSAEGMGTTAVPAQVKCQC